MIGEPPDPPDPPGNQRWKDRRDHLRPVGEPFNPSRYGVEILHGDGEAKEFVEREHYSASFPAARARVGLYRMRGFLRGQLVGVAVFSVPMNNRVIPRWTGLHRDHGVELGRFVLLDEVEGNGETWFLGQAFQALRAELPQVRAVLSYSDPVRRRSGSGHLITPGHVGTIYQAFNGIHVGRSKPRALLLNQEGRVIPERTISKLKKGGKGEEYAYRLFQEMGAPRRAWMEEREVYLNRALPFVVGRRILHPGNLAYLWAIGAPLERKRTARGFPPPLPYPKARETILEL